MSTLTTAQASLENAISAVSKYESDLRVTEMITSQSLIKINTTLSDPNFISLVNSMSCVSESVRDLLRIEIDKDNIESFSELLELIATSILEETAGVKQWADTNRC